MSEYTTKDDLNLSVDEGQQMLHFARHCWPLRHNPAPSGKQTWGDVFYKSYGITLEQFKRLMAEDKS